MILIIGTPSGGTSCTAHTLLMNGYEGGSGPWGENAYFAELFRHTTEKDVRFNPPVRPFDRWSCLENYRRLLPEKYVIKIPGLSLYYGEKLVDALQAKPLVVYRNPEKVLISGERRGFPLDSLREQCVLLKELMKRNPTWPVWNFGVDTHEDLEGLVGHPLPNKYYDKERLCLTIGKM